MDQAAKFDRNLEGACEGSVDRSRAAINESAPVTLQHSGSTRWDWAGRAAPRGLAAAAQVGLSMHLAPTVRDLALGHGAATPRTAMAGAGRPGPRAFRGPMCAAGRRRCLWASV
jgi:hypothetical protein